MIIQVPVRDTHGLPRLCCFAEQENCSPHPNQQLSSAQRHEPRECHHPLRAERSRPASGRRLGAAAEGDEPCNLVDHVEWHTQQTAVEAKRLLADAYAQGGAVLLEKQVQAAERAALARFDFDRKYVGGVRNKVVDFRIARGRAP